MALLNKSQDAEGISVSGVFLIFTEAGMLRLTANAFDEDRDRCLAAGMSDHIGKPVDPNASYTTCCTGYSNTRIWLNPDIYSCADSHEDADIFLAGSLWVRMAGVHFFVGRRRMTLFGGFQCSIFVRSPEVVTRLQATVMNPGTLQRLHQARSNPQRSRSTSKKNCFSTTNTYAMYEEWRRQPAAKIHLYRAPDSLIDFLKMQ